MRYTSFLHSQSGGNFKTKPENAFAIPLRTVGVWMLLSYPYVDISLKETSSHMIMKAGMPFALCV